MNHVLNMIYEPGIVPVIAINDSDKAVPLANALINGGIHCAEVTFRTAEAEESIRKMTVQVPNMLVGAGTVLTVEQADRALDAGARFIVSPGFNPTVVSHCIEAGVPIIPGCSSPSDMEQAIEFGLNTVKFFPAEQSGGLAFIKAVSAPYPQLKFMPTGGIGLNNISAYLANEKIIACGGSWMVKPELTDNQQYDVITRLCQEAVRMAMGFEFAHIGINNANKDEAENAAALFKNMFCFDMKPGNSSIFLNKEIEIMKSQYLGRLGHIGVGTNNVDRAVAYLKRQGVLFNEESAKFDSKNNLNSIYIETEIAGFALHLVRKSSI